MMRPALFVALGLAGCSQPPLPEPPQAVAAVTTPVVVPAAPTDPVNPRPVAALSPVPIQPVPPVIVPKPPEPPAAFEYPADLGGRAVAKAVTPTIPPLRPGEAFGTVPRPRTPPAGLLDPEPVARAEYVPPPILPTKPADVKPIAPPERIPPDLGVRADVVPAKPTFPVGAGVTERARDVNLPPPLPTLGRPPSDRVGLDDPAAEAGHAAIVSPTVKVPLGPAGFLKVTVPDPFELGEQIRPKVSPAAEPGLVPVVVNPQRVK